MRGHKLSRMKSKQSTFRILLALCFVLLVAGLWYASLRPPQLQEDTTDDTAQTDASSHDKQVAIPATMEPFLNTYCYNCHDSETQKGDLNLEEMTRGIGNITDATHWQDVLDKLNAGEMPPKKKKQPTDEELALVVGDLTESLQKAQVMLRDSGGEIALRRLNRREYEATVKELLGIRV